MYISIDSIIVFNQKKLFCGRSISKVPSALVQASAFPNAIGFANETGMNLDSKITGPDPKSMEQSEIPDVRKALTFRSPKRLAAWKFRREN